MDIEDSGVLLVLVKVCGFQNYIVDIETAILEWEGFAGNDLRGIKSIIIEVGQAGFCLSIPVTTALCLVRSSSAWTVVFHLPDSLCSNTPFKLTHQNGQSKALQ